MGDERLTAEPLRVDDVIEVWADRRHDPNDLGTPLRDMWRFIVAVGLLKYQVQERRVALSARNLSRLVAYEMVPSRVALLFEHTVKVTHHRLNDRR